MVGRKSSKKNFSFLLLVLNFPHIFQVYLYIVQVHVVVNLFGHCQFNLPFHSAGLQNDSILLYQSKCV